MPAEPRQNHTARIWTKSDNQRLEGPALKPQLDFWLETLQGELPVLELPTDRPRPSAMSYAGKTFAFELDATRVERLTAIGRSCGATLYMVLLAAFEVQLARLTGQRDIIVGTPIRGRNRPELEHLLGYFVNAMPLRMQLAPEESFKAFLARLKTHCVQAFGNQEVPFELLVQRLGLARDTSRTPLYSAFFTFQDVRNRRSSVGPLSYDQIHVHAPVSPTELSLWVKQLDHCVVGGLDFATDLFEDSTAQRWLDEYQLLLAGICEAPEANLWDLPLLTPSEQVALQRLVPEAKPFPEDAWLPELVAAQSAKTPSRVALRSANVTLTYAALQERVCRLANLLASRGVREGSRVGICLERGVDLVVAALAIHQCGAAYVPLDPAFPKERLAFMVEDSELKLIVVHSRTLVDAPVANGALLLDLDAEASALDASSTTPRPRPGLPTAQAAAYVIYTSGSTGKPKGVVVPQRAVVNFLNSMGTEPGLREQDRLLAVTTLSFDISVLELFGPLLVGAEVVIAGREVISDGELLDEAIEDHSITVMQATPSTWRLLLAAGFEGRDTFRALCGGEAFPKDLAQRLLEVCGEVWNMYGPTETTVWSTCVKLSSPLERITIGRPIDNTTIYVVDDRGHRTPWGVAGELWIGGEGVALGYHGRPELTAERFVASPFGPGRVYKTGDQVRLVAGGELEYLRRNDNQVKLRGFRIELGEIETALSTLPEVASAAVLVREDRPGDQRLVAYLVVNEGARLEDAALRTKLREGLPDYMVPQHFVQLERFPLTPNGKLDRKALPAPTEMGVEPSSHFVAPTTDSEKRLAELWQQVLGLPRVGGTDNFFELGGHSLLCLQMTAQLERQTGRRLNPRLVLRNNLAQLAILLDSPAEDPPPVSGSVAAEGRDAASPDSGARGGFARRFLDKLVKR